MSPREKEDLSKKLEESQSLLKEVEQYAPERIAQRIKALLVGYSLSIANLHGELWAMNPD